ncbi:hypothetical protein HNP48_006162 [Acidovorax soli]|jgi:hypothetical protein|uniref:Lipoprotein n=1 Tax=Acidovorax soli TaxID=592050 RepID=A0A7X0PK42_9BURK|nr:hypothetical protein [Acidovorax soli]MBB6563442.1 hypothetical protein [Acidovorax soli]
MPLPWSTTIATLGLAAALAACSPAAPTEWRGIPVVKDKLVKVETTTNDHGLYVEYSGVSRAEMLQRVATSMASAGYAKVGEAFEGNVHGYVKGAERLAVKVDQFGDQVFLAVFDAQGKEPLVHGVVFGQYQLGEKKTGQEAKDQLLKDLAK